jgi:predicted aspartyl protease
MGRIVTSVTIANTTDYSKSLRCDALVDTGTSHLTLPTAWKERLGALEQIRTVEVLTATQEVVEGAICGPVRVEIEGFPPIFGEALFVDMVPRDGMYEPLVGYIVLEQSQAAVDMLGHRLIHVKWLDLKRLEATDE